MKNDKKLFDLLTKLGFNKEENNYIIFTKDDLIIAYPKIKLSINHYYTTRYHLDYNGLMSKKIFNKKFKLEN